MGGPVCVAIRVLLTGMVLAAGAGGLPAVEAAAVRRVVIDPGHGGKDPGAVTPGGVQEKEITLRVSQELAELLRARDYEVLLTRTDDSFVPLSERAKLANAHEADLFLSIHCNASDSGRLKGFEVYFLSEKASDPRADAIARFENAPLALEGGAPAPDDRLSRLLRSMVKTEHINDSSELGALVHQHLSRRLSTDALGVKQAAFYVLRDAEMPAILIETGFLTNSKEGKRLNKAAYQRKIAEGVADAVDAYAARRMKAGS